MSDEEDDENVSFRMTVHSSKCFVINLTKNSAIRTLTSVVEATKNDPSKLWIAEYAWRKNYKQTTVAGALVNRFKEREENCRVDIIECFTRLLSYTVSAASSGVLVLASSSTMDDAYGAVVVDLRSNVSSAIVKACERQLNAKKGGDRSTVEADKLLKECKERRVAVLPHGESFQALRYENDGEICVVQGPITKPRQVDDEMVQRIANNLMIPKLGCAVICHGLVSASHLNGELGEVRDMKRSGTGIRLAVHFEKKGVKSALVKPENLRIAFELPDEVV